MHNFAIAASPSDTGLHQDARTATGPSGSSHHGRPQYITRDQYFSDISRGPHFRDGLRCNSAISAPAAIGMTDHLVAGPGCPHTRYVREGNAGQPTGWAPTPAAPDQRVLGAGGRATRTGKQRCDGLARSGLVRARSGVSYQRTAALPHMNPDPNAVMTTRSPGFTRPARTHSSSAIGIVAAVVFP